MNRSLLGKIVAIILAILMVLMTLTPILARAQYQKITPQEVCDSILRVASMGPDGVVTPLGTGFAIGSAAPVSYVVTSNHVVEKHADSLVVWMNLDHYVRATAVISLAQADLAVLKLETGINKPPLPLSLTEQVVQADTVYAYGFPDYDIHDFNMAYPSDVTVTRGAMSKKTTLNNINYYQFDASINSGNSGGPLWHENSGGVIGVVAVKSAVGDGINGAVCTEVLIEALDLQNIPYLLSGELAAMSASRSEGMQPLLIIGIVLSGIAVALLVIALVLRLKATAQPAQPESVSVRRMIEEEGGVKIADEASLTGEVDEVPDDEQSRIRRRATFSHDPKQLKPIGQPPVKMPLPEQEPEITLPLEDPEKTRVVQESKRLQRPVVQALEGFFQGAVVPVGRALLIGRDSARCQLVYPFEMTKISRVHVKIVYLPDSREFEVTDLSTNGVYLPDGTRLNKNTPKLLPCDTILWLSTQEEQVLLTVENV